MQIADYPGRGEPGTGELDLERLPGALVEPRLRRLGRPGVQADDRHRDSLAWLPRSRRAAPHRITNQQGARS